MTELFEVTHPQHTRTVREGIVLVWDDGRDYPSFDAYMERWTRAKLVGRFPRGAKTHVITTDTDGNGRYNLWGLGSCENNSRKVRTVIGKLEGNESSVDCKRCLKYL